jgi:flagellar biosynthetic protein FliP
MPLDLLAGLTIVALVPFLLVTTTSFIRIVVVLSLVRSAIGASGVALLLSAAIMTPTMRAIQREAIVPYAHGHISQTQMFAKAFEPLREFMLRQTHRRDLALFSRIARTHDGEGGATNPTVLIPAFVVGELRSAFAIGLALYLPFVAIDLAVASILMGLGMFMLSPPIVSLPCKLLLFVMVDGWSLVCGGVVSTFR